MYLSYLVTGLSWQVTRHHTSTLGACFGIQVAVETTELETKVQNYTLGRVVLTAG